MDQENKDRVLAEILCYLLSNDDDEHLLDKILKNKEKIAQSRDATSEEINEATDHWRRKRIWSPSM